ncbi:hypothetical protein [Nonomuraea sp. KM90]|uniref:hypothetical protein n=1 Tax=Nonomuraea sp. KM90 TaxID=3457428 RepID=UPI003FCE9F81
MMIPGGFVLEPVPHCASVPRAGWAGDHDLRPLPEQGRRQAEALAPMGGPVGGAYATGRMLRAVATMSAGHPGGRVVAASHGFDHRTVTVASRTA